MRFPLFAAALALVLHPASSLGQSPQSQPRAESRPDRLYRIGRQVRALVFDPREFFGPGDHFLTLVTILYTDAWGVPYHAIAVSGFCPSADRSIRICASARVARMVRRTRSSEALLAALAESGESTPAQIAARMDEAPPDWLEADLAACPAAAETIRLSDRLSWVPEEIPEQRPYQHGPLHAAHAEVSFTSLSRRATYSGFVTKGSPAEWAVRLAQDLEKCWRPATAPPPWRRPLP